MWIVLSLFPVWRWATAASPCCRFTVKHQLQSDLKEPEWICWLVNSIDWLLTASLCSPKWFLTSKHADITNHQVSCQTSGELRAFIGRWRALTPPSSSWYNTYADKSQHKLRALGSAADTLTLSLGAMWGCCCLSEEVEELAGGAGLNPVRPILKQRRPETDDGLADLSGLRNISCVRRHEGAVEAEGHRKPTTAPPETNITSCSGSPDTETRCETAGQFNPPETRWTHSFRDTVKSAGCQQMTHFALFYFIPLWAEIYPEMTKLISSNDQCGVTVCDTTDMLELPWLENVLMANH